MSSVTSLTSYFNTTSFGDTNSYTRNQDELALTLNAAAQELSNWKSLLTMSAGGGFFEGGRLAARVLLGATPALCAVPFLANAFTFAAGAMADTGLTGILNQAFGNEGEEEGFWAKMMDQSSVRGMGLLGAGQSFVVIQLMQGLASAGRGMLCEKKSGNGAANGAFLHSMIQGLRCYFGSGMFTTLTRGVVSSVEQRMSLRSRNMNVGAYCNTPLQNFGKRVLGSLQDSAEKLTRPLHPAGLAGLSLSTIDSSDPTVSGGGGGAAPLPKLDRKKLGAFIRSRREAKGLTQSKLGEISGIRGQTHISQIESGSLQASFWNYYDKIRALQPHLRLEGDSEDFLISRIQQPESTGRRSLAPPLRTEVEETAVSENLRKSEAYLARFAQAIAADHIPTLQTIEGRALPALRARLGNQDPKTRAEAAKVLLYMNEKEDAAGDLIRLLDDPHQKVQSTALLAVGSLGSAGKPAIPKIMGFLKRPENRAIAAHSLGNILYACEERVILACAAIPDLIRLLREADSFQSASAEWALVHIGEPAMIHLLRGYQETNPETRRRYADALGRMQFYEKERKVTRTLSHCLQEADPRVRFFALLACERLDTRAYLLFEEVLKCVEDRDPLVQTQAIKVLAVAGKEAVPRLTSLLGHPLAVYRNAAEEVLEKLGYDAHPALIAGLSHSNPDISRLSARLLSRRSIYNPEAYPPLLVLLSDPDPQTRIESAKAMGAMQTRREDILAALTLRGEDEKDHGVQEAIEKALRKTYLREV